MCHLHHIYLFIYIYFFYLAHNENGQLKQCCTFLKYTIVYVI